jgi:hypothetical protein
MNDQKSSDIQISNSLYTYICLFVKKIYLFNRSILMHDHLMLIGPFWMGCCFVSSFTHILVHLDLLHFLLPSKPLHTDPRLPLK